MKKLLSNKSIYEARGIMLTWILFGVSGSLSLYMFQSFLSKIL